MLLVWFALHAVHADDGGIDEKDESGAPSDGIEEEINPDEQIQSDEDDDEGDAKG